MEDCLQIGHRYLNAKEDIVTPTSESSETNDKDESAITDSVSVTSPSEVKEDVKEESVNATTDGSTESDSAVNVKESEKVVQGDDERTKVESSEVKVVDQRTREREGRDDLEDSSSNNSNSSSSVVVLKPSNEDAGPPVITPAPECSSADDDGPLSRSSPFRMDDAAGTAVSRFPDDRSDSGVSSLRSGSGDERSGSRSSALSSSDEPQPQLQSNQPTRSPLFIPTSNSHPSEKSNSEPVRVWRDPNLAAEPRVRHVQSVQHQTLLMSHPPPASAPQPPSSNSAPSVSQAQQALALAQAQAAHYPPVPPPPLLSPHPLHVPLPPPGLYSQLPDVLWKQRYPPLPVGPHLLGPTHPAAEELLERERAYVQDRDRLLR